MRTTSKALKISYFQELYKQYSRLGFTRSDDRPFAIAGLEKRLLKAYGTAGATASSTTAPTPRAGYSTAVYYGSAAKKLATQQN